jgi:polyphosphate glucokinase
MIVLGIDVGGSGIKGAPVDLEAGELTQERHRIQTPKDYTPDAVAEGISRIVRHFDWNGPLGCTLPMVVRHHTVRHAGNMDPVGLHARDYLQERIGLPLVVLNDADAAGIGEMYFGAGVGEQGLVMMLTFGTGLGSAVFVNRVLVPYTAFGDTRVRGKKAGEYASDRARRDNDLTWKQWARRVNRVLARIEDLIAPDLFIIGGGASEEYDKFLPLLRADARIAAARLGNDAGIVGAALLARASLAPEPAAADAHPPAAPSQPSASSPAPSPAAP